MNVPFFHVEGAQFFESHTVARLIGSPSGYVGPDKARNTGRSTIATLVEDRKDETATAVHRWIDV